jgi:protein-S-isoprenylcysteine O-methyltransferase Ste14
MENRMSVMGIGLKAGAVIGLYMILTVFLSFAFTPLFRITSDFYSALLITGIVMAAVGFSLNLAAAFQMLRAYKKDTLATGGLYGVFLHPMYFFQVFVTLPGILLLFNSWLALSTVLVGIAAVKVFEKEENRYLENRYGDAYRQYRHKVLIRF